MNRWEFEADGVKHKIQYIQGFRKKIIVDGETFKAKSSNMLINFINYQISFGSIKCRLVVLGNKADLAVNGIFLESKKPYKTIDNIIPLIYIFIGVNLIGNIILFKIHGLLSSILVSVAYLKFGIQKKTAPAIIYFTFYSITQVIIEYIILSLLH